ncbi:hypothetical protein IMZ48_13700, partial [Candidatus Bathyarchaeota archaeon]|nr:hypothetical protein [Candidatus Bathyarchaeota archaeon]
PYDGPQRRPRRRSPSSSSSSSSAGLPERAHNLVKNTFTDSRSGLGVGILGALVGGIVAHGVSSATVRARHKGSSGPAGDPERATRLAAVAGAVAGGLGANAMEKRYEESRRRDRLGRDEWVRRWGEDGGFWQSEWDQPLDYPRGRSRRRGTDEYEVVYEERKPRRKSEGAYYRR